MAIGRKGLSPRHPPEGTEGASSSGAARSFEEQIRKETDLEEAIC